ncbi:MAG: two-component sensor histidine kinase [Sphingomonas bacterium]|nr:two-component sensor histidine kinase [Sphingomonas bacterium]MDB5685321.1 two-component sensor histidine kinase [Sphingomonas bacterium]MDB5719186.1 two-component sensor histidine kinase [Sphingomonas bacterium]
MIRFVRPSLGLLGRIVAILLLTVVIEFGASTLLYERASRFSVREDEARRLAEHLVIARKLVAERPWQEREAMAERLATDRYDVRWTPSLPPPPRLAPELDEMRRQIVAWEPTLANTDLRLQLTSPGRRSVVTGGLSLPDGSWLYFATREIVHGWDLAVGRVVLALVPAIALMLLAALLIRRTLLPLRTLAQAAGRIRLGESLFVAEAGTGEVRRVIRAVNDMQGRINRLLADRTHALAAVGHDLRTPLSRLQLRLDGVQDDVIREEMGGDIAEMEAMVASLLAYLGGESDPEVPVRVDVAVLAATIVDDLNDRGIDAEYCGPQHVEMIARPVAVKRALANLVDNAIHYGCNARILVIDGADAVVLAVEDDGPGIPEHQLADAVEPFTRLDLARGRNTQGLGLGLAIVNRWVEREGGRLDLSNRPTGGLSARITLPRH